MAPENEEESCYMFTAFVLTSYNAAGAALTMETQKLPTEQNKANRNH
jgi:hypothetical protein